MTLHVFTFSPDWGLPSVGPFAIKLLAWLELAGIAYEQVPADDPRKGPTKKNPWIELDGEAIGDSEIIIDLLSRRHGIDLDAELTAEQKALGHAWRRAFEEHFHQVLEWELFAHPAGVANVRASMLAKMPPIVGPLVFKMLRSRLLEQLHARGIARHAPDIVASKGRADLDALAVFLGERPFLVADRPSTADCAVFGLLAPMIYWPMATPVADHAKSLAPIKAYCDRMNERCFAKHMAATAVA